MSKLLEDIVLESEEKMLSTIEAFQTKMLQIRSGRANPSLVSDIVVDVYGQRMQIQQIANIVVSEARQLTISVWDKSNLEATEKAILSSNRNLQPQGDGSIIRIQLPEMTQDTRKDMVKLAREKTEEHRVSIRNIRRDSNELIKKQKGLEGFSDDIIHNYQDRIQELTDRMIKEVSEILEIKEKEILKV